MNQKISVSMLKDNRLFNGIRKVISQGISRIHPQSASKQTDVKIEDYDGGISDYHLARTTVMNWLEESQKFSRSKPLPECDIESKHDKLQLMIASTKPKGSSSRRNTLVN